MIDQELLFDTVKKLFNTELKPFQLDYLADLLDPTQKHIISCWCRQSGKSMTTGFACVFS